VKYEYQKLPYSDNKEASPRSQNVERKRDHEFIRRSISNKTPQTINEKRTFGVKALRRSLAKQFATGGLNQVEKRRGS
jgi:hypothetical protein